MSFNENWIRTQPRFVFPQKQIRYKPPKKFDPYIKRPALEYAKGLNRSQLISNFYGIEPIPIVDIGKSTLSQLIEVKEPDPNDSSWLKEKQRLVRQWTAQGLDQKQIEQKLKDEPPLGRQQYTRQTNRSISQSTLKLEGKLRELDQHVTAGNVQNSQDIANLFMNLSGLLQTLEQDLTSQQVAILSRLLQSIPDGVSKDDLKIDFNYIDSKYYNANKGEILMFLFKQQEKDPALTINKPLYSAQGRAISITTLSNYIQRGMLIITNPLDPRLKNVILQAPPPPSPGNILTLAFDQVQMLIKADPSLTRQAVQGLFSFDITPVLDQLMPLVIPAPPPGGPP